MWGYFTQYGVWILIVAAAWLILLLFANEWVKKIIEKAAPTRLTRALPGGMNFAVGITGGIALVIAVTALVAITLSKRGVNAVITTASIQEWFLEHGILIVVIILVSYIVYRFLKTMLPGIIERSIKGSRRGRRAREEVAKRAHTVSGIIVSTTGIIIALIAVFIILSDFGIDITPLLAGAGVVGIAVGFGAQSLIKDVLTGLFIIMEDQYGKGDWVKIADVNGLVVEINLRRTVLRDLDGTVHSIPNGEVRIASNFTKEISRVNLNIPVAYGEDLDHVTEVINRIGNELARDEVYGSNIKTAPHVLRVDKFADSGIEIKIVGETKPMQQWATMGELRKRIKKAFDEEGIEIPWPHVKLYFGKSPENQQVPCAACSAMNLKDRKFCSNCGAPLTTESDANTEDSQQDAGN
ncbi:mechanosensitive ion channel family protein [Chloroflexota bacterium]